ncbi:MAG: NAD(P)-dependent oxidoreductase, partial [Planctomycetes bacterium]|nr:NAD(P)-dependent oxidoreductase [Planctomycetota bacterium]
AIYLAAADDRAQGVLNLGSGEAITIRDIVERVRDYIDPSAELGFAEVPFRPDQVMHLQADITCLKKQLNWTPRVRLDRGLQEIVEWYRDNHSRYVA